MIRVRLLTRRVLSVVLTLSVAAPLGVEASARTHTLTPRARSKAQSAPRSAASSAARARRARLARARAEAARRARELRELQTPRFRVDEHGNIVPDVRAEAAIIYDPDTGEILWEANAQHQRSIASITKVMTAIVFLEDNPDLSEVVTVQRSDVRNASVTYLRVNERLSLRDVLHLALVASDNAAARILARVSSHGAAGFVARMNDRAAELGLAQTSYRDPSGLEAANVSSAYDMARLIAYASQDPRIAGVMQKPTVEIRTNRRTLRIQNTNKLVRDLDVLGGKTGFIAKAGYCLATLLQLPGLNQQVAVVVLGARSNAARFWETRHLFNWLIERVK